MSNPEGQLLYHQQKERFINAYQKVSADYEAVYKNNEIQVGWQEGVYSMYEHSARASTVAVIGGQWGDEGKGRIIDNELDEMLRSMPNINLVYVIRYQGGSNAGHTIYTQSGEKIPLHQVPSGVLHPEAVGIMDSGMIIHMEDLRTEIVDAEKISEVGDLRGKLILSEEAMLCTDLERAEEVLNRDISEGKASGGTGRGISPTVAHSIDRTGLQVMDLMADNWQETFTKRYDDYAKRFSAFNRDVADMDVPDLRETRNQRKEIKRKVGTKQEYLDRLTEVRQWYIDREASVDESHKMVQNTFLIHRKASEQLMEEDLRTGVIFEGAQSVGLNKDYGRKPDVTATDTSLWGTAAGTKFWTRNDIRRGIGVVKLTYSSSVGDEESRPLTVVDLSRTDILAEEGIQSTEGWTGEKYWEEISKLTGYSQEQKRALWIREVAREVGTTTRRYRDICELDLELLRYNIHMGGIEMLAGTHLDLARADQEIRICTHYTDETGQMVPYQPGVRHQKKLTPHYVTVPGFDGEAVKKAKSLDDLPLAAQQLLSFIQRQTGTPITIVTTGPERQDLVKMPDARNN